MLEHLPLLRLRFAFEILTPAQLSPYKGDLLRRALLWHLAPLWCEQSGRCRHGCQHPETCLFGRLLEPPPRSEWAESLQRLMGDTPPPAYVLWDYQDRRRDFQAGDRLQIELTLIGDLAISQQPAFVAALLAAGDRGLGSSRLKLKLTRAEVLAGYPGTPLPLLEGDVWRGWPSELAVIRYDQETATVLAEPATRLRLRYLSPLKIKMRGETATRPDFPAVMRAVIRRLRILSQVHGAGEWPHETWGPLLDLAEQVRLEHHETTWISAQRHSAQGVMPLDGLVGEAWYAAPVDLRPLLPALWLGQWVHIGKAAVWGNGRYEVKTY